MTSTMRAILQRLQSWGRVIPNMLALRARAKAARQRVALMTERFDHAARNAQSATDELMRQMELQHAQHHR